MNKEALYKKYESDIRRYVHSLAGANFDEAFANANFYIWQRLQTFEGKESDAKNMMLNIAKKAVFATVRKESGLREIDYRNNTKIGNATFKLKSEGRFSDDALMEETGLSPRSIQVARAAKRMVHLDAQVGEEEGLTVHDVIADKPKDIGKHEQLIRNTLEKMKADYREVIILHDFQGYEYTEIAAAIKQKRKKYISPEGVRVRHIRAMRELRDRLGVV